jgi:hypothetical protein
MLPGSPLPHLGREGEMLRAVLEALSEQLHRQEVYESGSARSTDGYALF